MHSSQRLIHATIILALTFFGIAGLYTIAGNIGKPKLFDSAFESFESHGASIALPIANSSFGGLAKLSGELPRIILADTDPVWIYIPKFEGRLTIFADGKSLFSTSSPSDFAMSGRALFGLLPEMDGSLPKLTFSLEEDLKSFISLSKVYVGSESDFDTAMRQSGLLMSWLPVVLLGISIPIVFMLLTLIFATPLATMSYPTLVVSVFILLNSLNAIDYYIYIPPSAMHIVALCCPVLIANLWLMGENLSRESAPESMLLVQTASIILSIALIIWSYSETDEARLLPSICAAILTCAGLAFVSVRSFVLSLKRLDLISGYFAISNAVFLAALSHDIAIRAGYNSSDLYIASSGKVFFMIFAAISFGKAAFDASDKLKKSNSAIAEALAKRTSELQSAFAVNEDLLRERASSEERARMRQELHDGVLGYLSIINILTDGKTSGEMGVINRSSRWASNEIRLFLENDGSREIALLVAISNLRRQFIDRLSELGIAIDFDIGALAQLDDLDFKLVIETIRILQEAVHNAAIRSHSTHLLISAEVISLSSVSVPLGFRLIVRNSGGTTFSPNVPFGNGLRNMWRRAIRVGGALHITGIEGGAELVFTWPAVFDLSSPGLFSSGVPGSCCVS